LRPELRPRLGERNVAIRACGDARRAHAARERWRPGRDAPGRRVAARTGDAAPAAAIAAITTIGYLGSFTGPPAIGAIAEASSLSTALAALVVASALLTILAKQALAGAARGSGSGGAGIRTRIHGFGDRAHSR
jgi:hypothetical protein